MKKIITLILILLIASSAAYIQIEATPVEKNLFDVTTVGLSSTWNSPSSALITAQPIALDFDDSDFRVNTMMLYGGSVKQIFVISNSKITSRVRVSSKTNDSLTLATFYFQYGSSTSEMILVDSEGDPADLGQYKDNNIWITIAMNETHVGFSDVSPIKTAVNASIKTYMNFLVYYDPVVINPDPGDPISFDQLPITAGSIYDISNGMADVSWEVNGYTVNFEIQYNGVYQMSYTFTENTDMSIFEDSLEAFYYSYQGGKFIVFNRGEESMFTTRNFKTQTFVPYTIWNLQTNELSNIDEFNVYIYGREEAGNNYYAYFYVDEFVIENLLSATVSMQYRYVPIVGAKGDWMPYFKVLEIDNINPGNISWQLSAAAVSATATIIGGMIPGIGLPIFLIGTPITAALIYLSGEQLVQGEALFTGSIQEIQEVSSPSTSLLNEINAAYYEYYNTFTGLNLDQYTLWKLHLGTFNKLFMQGIEINQEEDPAFNIIQFRYMTAGEVYTINEENINVVFNPGALDEKDVLIPIPGLTPDVNVPKVVIYVIIGIAGLVLLSVVLRAADSIGSSTVNLMRNPRKILAIIGIFGIIALAIILALG